MTPEDDDLVGVLRLRWPSEIERAEELLAAAGIPFDLVEMFDGEEWDLRVPGDLAEAARELLADLADPRA
jgi:hypothetical protein